MIKVAGHWDLSWNTPIKEAELWNFPLRDFGVAEWYMWPVSGIKHNERESVALHERENLVDILEENLDLPFVFMEPTNKVLGVHPIDMTDFTHPEDALYVFGSAHYNPVAAGLPREGDHVVRLPTLHNAGVLWPHQVLVAALYHRLVQ